MENALPILITAVCAAALLRILVLPLKWGVKLLLHAGLGFLCLWMLNTVSDVTGLYFPINAVTALVAGFLGVPGIGILALLQLF